MPTENKPTLSEVSASVIDEWGKRTRAEISGDYNFTNNETLLDLDVEQPFVWEYITNPTLLSQYDEAGQTSFQMGASIAYVLFRDQYIQDYQAMPPVLTAKTLTKWQAIVSERSDNLQSDIFDAEDHMRLLNDQPTLHKFISGISNFNGTSQSSDNAIMDGALSIYLLMALGLEEEEQLSEHKNSIDTISSDKLKTITASIAASGASIGTVHAQLAKGLLERNGLYYKTLLYFNGSLDDDLRQSYVYGFLQTCIIIGLHNEMESNEEVEHVTGLPFLTFDSVREYESSHNLSVYDYTDEDIVDFKNEQPNINGLLGRKFPDRRQRVVTMHGAYMAYKLIRLPALTK